MPPGLCAAIASARPNCRRPGSGVLTARNRFVVASARRALAGASLIPLEAASVPVAVVPGGLSGILKSHYLAVLNPEISYFLLILIPILFVTAVAWLIDWYGLRLVSWFLSRLRKRSIPAEKF